MTKNEYVVKRNSLYGKINAIERELRKLDGEYIESNSNFPIGSKVYVITPENAFIPQQKRLAYVTGYEVIGDDVRPVLKRSKKNGGQSAMNDFLWYHEKVELVDDKK